MDRIWHVVQALVLIGLNIVLWPILYKVAKVEIVAMWKGDTCG